MNSTRNLAKRLASIVNDLIESLQKAYDDFSVEFLLQRDYLHKVIMTLIAPVGLKVKPISFETPYFSYGEKKVTQSSCKEKAWGPIEKVSFKERNQDSIITYQKAIKMAKEKQKYVEKPIQKVVHPKQIKEMFNSKTKKMISNISVGNYCNKNMVYGVHPSFISLSNDQENELCAWVKELSKNGKTLTRLEIRQKARAILNVPYFQATQGWFRRFIKRHPMISDYLHPNQDQYSDIEERDSDSSEGWKGVTENELSKQQFMELGRQKGLNISEEELNKIFDEADTDKKGFISYDVIERMNL